MDKATLLEYQDSIIEWQREIISELMGLYSKEPTFELPGELQERMREVNRMYLDMNKP